MGGCQMRFPAKQKKSSSFSKRNVKVDRIHAGYVSICFDNLGVKVETSVRAVRRAWRHAVVRSAEHFGAVNMQHGIHKGTALRAGGALTGVSQFAVEVVARLVSRDPAEEVAPREDVLERFIAAIATSDPMAFEELKPELKRARISAAMLADIYIPEAARRLGQGWMDDTATFAEVTMGVARMQAILREIGTAWIADCRGQSVGPTMLVVLPVGEQHTLGGMVLAGRLRRLGISVSMQIAPSVADLGAYVAARAFDGAMISIAGDDKLETCAKLIKIIKEASKGSVKVAVGGALLETGHDVSALTGADVVTNNIEHALSVMGIVTSKPLELEFA
jgi:hypothetical protein